MNKVRRALVFADHSQFYIQDIDGQTAAETDEGYDWPEARSEEAVAVCRIGVDGPCSIAIGTARSDYVETALRVHDAEPPLVEAEHIVEADLTVPSGVVHVFGCMELPRPEHRDASLKGDSRAAGRRTFASGGSAHHREARRGETDPAAYLSNFVRQHLADLSLTARTLQVGVRRPCLAATSKTNVSTPYILSTYRYMHDK